MISARFHTLILALLMVLGAVNGCTESPTAPSRPQIFAGTSRALATGSVTPAGGSVTVDLPGDSLDGLTIDVPFGAYEDGRTFRVSASTIEGHELGSDFNPLTPLIKIENGGGYSDVPMELTIPCTIPDGHFAMAFVYDRATGMMEGMPLSAVGEGSITVLTSNFNFSAFPAMSKSALRNDGIVVGNSEIVVSSIPEAKLNEPSNSGFVPLVDNWQFTNYGSHLYLGHCAGMSATMIWYYSARKQLRGDEPLNGRFDNDGARTTPKIWEDDVAGYRFTGVAQVDLPWGTLNQRLQTGLEGTLPAGVTYNLFAYAIRITKQPQFIWIISEKGIDSGSHAMVVYKASNGILSICDPNYPKEIDRPLEYSRGKFLPYYSGPNAQNVGVKYTTFYYLAQFSIIDATGLSKNWGKVIDGTIGIDRYPSYTIMGRNSDGTMSTLTDGFVTNTGRLEFDVRNSDVPLKVTTVYNADEQVIPIVNGAIQLRYGKQLLGFCVTDLKSNWVGFNWIEVESKEDGTVPVTPLPSESGNDCAGFYRIDSVGTLETHSSYEKYTDGMFSYLGEFPGGSLRMTVVNFTGVGVYPLHYTGSPANRGSHIFFFNGNASYGDGTMTITRFDAEKVEGTFAFQTRNSAGLGVKKVTGEFYCSR